MNYRIVNIRFFLIQAVVVMFLGCSDDISNAKINQKPILNITYNVDALNVTIEGRVIDYDGTISKVKIDWGDNKIDILLESEFLNIEESHTYLNPAPYNILITTIDNDGDSTNQSLSLVVDFKDVSLDNIKESMFKTSDNEYLILTVNLHTYQENMQNEKFHMLTEAIGKMDIDFIAFQECAQNKSASIYEGIIREDNMALIISNNLKENYDVDYNFVWNWAHYGWDVWEEGVAILSKYPLQASEDKYISTSTNTSNIASRKVIYGAYLIPEGKINIFSAHTHWRTSETDEEQNKQIKNVKQMVEEKEALNSVIATFVCGDFNGNPTSDYPWSEGYNTMVNNGVFVDTYLEIYPDANTKPAQSIYNTIGGTYPGRIDYIFMKNNTSLKVLDSQIIFTDDIIGKISDHNAVLTKVGFIQ